MSPALLFFIVVGAVSLAAAVGVVSSREPIHSALFLLTNFVTPRRAVCHVGRPVPGRGAGDHLRRRHRHPDPVRDHAHRQRADRHGGEASRCGRHMWASCLGVILVASMIYTFAGSERAANRRHPPWCKAACRKSLGMELFTHYILPFELAAVLLLVALLGALLMARQPKSDPADRSSCQLLTRTAGTHCQAIVVSRRQPWFRPAYI